MTPLKTTEWWTKQTWKQELETFMKSFRTLANSKEHLRLFLIQLLTKICWIWSCNNLIDTRRDKRAYWQTCRHWKSKYKQPRRTFSPWMSSLRCGRLKFCKEGCRIRRSLYQNVRINWLRSKTTWTNWSRHWTKVWPNWATFKLQKPRTYKTSKT